jgi:hypothetical protein
VHDFVKASDDLTRHIFNGIRIALSPNCLTRSGLHSADGSEDVLVAYRGYCYHRGSASVPPPEMEVCQTFPVGVGRSEHVVFLGLSKRTGRLASSYTYDTCHDTYYTSAPQSSAAGFARPGFS